MNAPVRTCEWTVTGMDCGSCADKIRTAVERLPGVSEVEVALMSERLRAKVEEGGADNATIEATVRKLGYDIAPRTASAPAPHTHDHAGHEHDHSAHLHETDGHEVDGHKTGAPSDTGCEWTVTGMDCGSCADKIRTAVERLPGVSDVEVSLMSERMRAKVDQAVTDSATVETTVRKLGYDIAPRNGAAPSPGTQTHHHSHDHAGHEHSGQDHEGEGAGEAGGHDHDNPADRGKRWYQTRKGHLVVLTGALLVVAWTLEILWPSLGLWPFVLACLVGVAPVARKAFALLRTGQPFSIESLMTIAAIGALWIGAAEEAALVVFLFAVGEVLEGVAANKARDGIRALANLVPKTARLETAQGQREVPANPLRLTRSCRLRRVSGFRPMAR